MHGLGLGRISLPVGFEPATPWSEVGSANCSATKPLNAFIHIWHNNRYWSTLLSSVEWIRGHLRTLKVFGEWISPFTLYVLHSESGTKTLVALGWFDFCFTVLQHILGNFGRGQLPLPHCSWTSPLGSLPVLSTHSFANNWQLLFLNQRKRENDSCSIWWLICSESICLLGSESRTSYELCSIWWVNHGPSMYIYLVCSGMESGTIKASCSIWQMNFLNIRTPKNFVVITLKFELCGSTIE